MAPPRAPRARRRPRAGSLERPVNARSYRGTWLLAGLPLLVAAFSLSALPTLPPLKYTSTFDETGAATNAQSLTQRFPDRRPGTTGARGATTFVEQQLEASGYKVTRDQFHATVAGLGSRQLVNLVAEAPGRSRDAIVVLAHRDNAGGAALADDASGTAALLELARAYGSQPGGTELTPLHTIVFISTDGGAYGAAGAERFAAAALGHRPLLAAIALDGLDGTGAVRIVLASDGPSSPDPALVGTARDAIQRLAPSLRVAHASGFHQLLDLAFPYSLYEQAPFIARGTPAIALTTGGDRPPSGAAPDPRRLKQLGNATGFLIARLDNAGPTSTSTRTYVLLGTRRLPGWTIQLLLLTALLPALVAIVDLFARCRRRGIPLRPALRSLRSRGGYWLSVLLVFELMGLLHLFPYGTSRPVSPETSAAQSWPTLSLALLFVLAGGAWLVARERLIPREPPTLEEEVAGHTAALLGLAVLSLVLVALNRYTLLLVLPSLHAWLWLPQMRARPRWLRSLVFVAGLAGPAWLVHAFATRLAIGFDTPWYLTELAVVHVISFPLLVAFVAWLAIAGQLLTLTTGHYAPYPRASELPPRGPLRESVRRLALAGRAAQAAAPATRRRAQGE